MPTPSGGHRAGDVATRCDRESHRVIGPLRGVLQMSGGGQRRRQPRRPDDGSSPEESPTRGPCRKGLRGGVDQPLAKARLLLGRQLLGEGHDGVPPGDEGEDDAVEFLAAALQDMPGIADRKSVV